MDLRVTISINDTIAVIGLRGELDLHTTPTLQATVDSALESRISAVVLDLTELTFLDSHSIGVIVGCFNAAQRTGRSLSLRDPGPHVARILSITAIDRLIAIEHTSLVTPDSLAN